MALNQISMKLVYLFSKIYVNVLDVFIQSQ